MALAKGIIKRSFIAVAIITVVLQVYRIPQNKSNQKSINDITSHYTVPQNVEAILKKACYDCHSNNTYYPWYNNVQPISWWINDHVKSGKKHLNFSEFASYKIKRKYKKLKETVEEINEGEMPMSSYTLMHKEAKLTDDEKLLVTNWANNLANEIATTYPDSLK